MGRCERLRAVMRVPERARAMLMPLFLLALLLAGGASHDRHHLFDPHCGSEAAGESHPCMSCAALHGATAAEIGTGIAPPSPHQHALRPHHASETPLALARGTAPPRAPPIA